MNLKNLRLQDSVGDREMFDDLQLGLITPLPEDDTLSCDGSEYARGTACNVAGDKQLSHAHSNLTAPSSSFEIPSKPLSSPMVAVL